MKKVTTCCMIPGATVVALLLVALFTGFHLINTAIKTGIEKIGPMVTKTTVKVDEVDARVFSYAGGLSGLVVGNPDGFSGQQSLSISKINAEVDPDTLFEKVVVIKEIHIDGMQVNYQQGLTGSNIGKLLDNITGTAKAGGTKEEAGGTRVVIKKFRFTNGKVVLGAMGVEASGAPLPIPEIVITDIGEKSKPLTIAEAVYALFKPIFLAVFKKAGAPEEFMKHAGDALEGIGGALKKGPEELMNKAGGAAKDALKGVKDAATQSPKDLGEKAGKAGKDAVDSVKETIKEGPKNAIDSVKKLFGD